MDAPVPPRRTSGGPVLQQEVTEAVRKEQIEFDDATTVDTTATGRTTTR